MARDGGVGARRGEGRQPETSAGAEVYLERDGAGGGEQLLPAGERRSLCVSRWCRVQAAGQSDAVAPTPAGRGAWKGLQPLTES